MAHRNISELLALSSRLNLWVKGKMFDKRSVILIVVTTICAVSTTPLPSDNEQNDVNIGPKIINGTVAKPEETRHQVSIRLKSLDWYFGAGHICGGSLIKPSVVLTAAHCIYNYQLKVMRTADEFTISMGSIDRYDRQTNSVFEVLEIAYQDTFNSSTFIDDIAIIFINGYIAEGHPTIHTIDINWDPVPDDTLCQVTGWGVTEDGYTSDLLMSLDVPIVNHTLCALNYEGFVKDGMICAGYIEGMKDACNGDSGGPLVCNGKLTGIVSFGSGCALPNYPGVYTEVSYHSKWIREVTGGVDFLKSSMILLILTVSIFLA